MKTLFDSFQVGDLVLKNRIVMAPLTRSRAGVERVPNDLMRDYYVQRASAGLILSEATAISAMGVGYADTPGIWSEVQVDEWRKITTAVHTHGTPMFLQLWHVGRISDPYFLNGATPVAPSAIAPNGHLSLLRPKRAFVTPRALAKSEVKQIILDYRRGAENAKRAGFDGVEVHAANGYLIDQFLQTGSNQREDEYGGSVENRARFLLEIVDQLLEVWGPERVGVHLAPRGDSNYISDANPRETFSYVARELGRRKLAFLFIRERQGEGYLTPELKNLFGGPVIANEGLDAGQAQELLQSGAADLISFGRLFIANPDLPERLRTGAGLNAADVTTFYSPGPKGYVDFPSLTGSQNERQSF